MKKQTFISTASILLLFFTSCIKTYTETEGENKPSPSIVYQFYLIDKDSNTLYKYPDILSSKYDPHQLYATDKQGDKMTKTYITYRQDSSGINCDIDTLKNGSVFCILLTKVIKNSADTIYYVHYNSIDIDTLSIINGTNYIRYNNKYINKYRGVFLIIK